jgi:NTE family protein
MGALRIVGVDLLRDRSFKYQMDEVPSAGRLLADKLRGRRNRLPGLTSLLLNTSTMYSYARQRETHRLVDMYFSPGVHRFGMLDWAQFDRIVQAGYDYARAELDRDGFAKALTAHPAREREAEEVQLPDIAAGGAQLPA